MGVGLSEGGVRCVWGITEDHMRQKGVGVRVRITGLGLRLGSQ